MPCPHPPHFSFVTGAEEVNITVTNGSITVDCALQDVSVWPRLPLSCPNISHPKTFNIYELAITRDVA